MAEHVSQRRPSASRQSSQGQPHHTIVKDDEGKRPAGKDPPPPLHLAGRQTRLQRVLPIQCPTTALRWIRHTHKRRILAETPTTACLFAQFCHVSSSQRNFAFSRITAKRCCSDSFPNEPCPCQSGTSTIGVSAVKRKQATTCNLRKPFHSTCNVFWSCGLRRHQLQW